MSFTDLKGQFIVLTTFRRDGTPVPTTVWFARFGDDIVIASEPGTGKVKRIRHNPEVTVTRSNYRGKPKGGPTIEGTARFLDGDDAAQAESELRRKYGLQWKLFSRNAERILIAVTGGRS